MYNIVKSRRQTLTIRKNGFTFLSENFAFYHIYLCSSKSKYFAMKIIKSGRNSYKQPNKKNKSYFLRSGRKMLMLMLLLPTTQPFTIIMIICCLKHH